MNLREAIRLAGTSLNANQMRSVLTLLGVIIGIASVIAILTIGSGLRAQTVGSLESTGIGDVTVTVQERSEDDDPFTSFYAGAVDPEEYEEALISVPMLENLPAVGSEYSVHEPDEAEVTVMEGASVTGLSAAANLEGINEHYLNHISTDIVAGRGITAQDVAAAQPAVVISTEMVNTIFSGDTERALGAGITAETEHGDVSFPVVGIYNPTSGEGMAAWTDPIEHLYVPYPVVKEITDAPEGFNQVTIRPRGTWRRCAHKLKTTSPPFTPSTRTWK